MVASRRSGVTVAAVTVTMASRGSLTWCCSSVATMVTMRLASRRARAVSAMVFPPVLGTGYDPGPAGSRCQRRYSGLSGSFVMRADHPSPGCQQFDLHLVDDLAFAAVQYPLHLGDIRRNRRDGDQRPAVPIGVTGLGDGDLQPAQPVHDRPDDRPLVLERVHRAEQHVALQHADVGRAEGIAHFSPPRPAAVVLIMRPGQRHAGDSPTSATGAA